MISPDTSDPSNRVILDTNLPVPNNNHPGLSAEILADWAKRLSRPLVKDAMDYGLDPRMEARINLLDRIPAIWLKGDLKALRFDDDQTQAILIELAPNYRNW